MIRPLVHYVRTRIRLWISIAAGLAITVLLRGSPDISGPVGFLLGWDAGVVLYLALCLIMISRATIDHIKHRARIEDEGRIVILMLTAVGAAISLWAIIAELASGKSGPGGLQTGQIALSVATILLSWLFTHTIFALHYAHEYYTPDDDAAPRELQFPGRDEPDYWDFLYFSFILGTSAQTADVAITGRTLRRVALAQCVLAFLFNTTILALTINIAAGLVQSK